jgi:hypothetical protein
MPIITKEEIKIKVEITVTCFHNNYCIQVIPILFREFLWIKSIPITAHALLLAISFFFLVILYKNKTVKSVVSVYSFSHNVKCLGLATNLFFFFFTVLHEYFQILSTFYLGVNNYNAHLAQKNCLFNFTQTVVKRVEEKMERVNWKQDYR